MSGCTVEGCLWPCLFSLLRAHWTNDTDVLVEDLDTSSTTSSSFEPGGDDGVGLSNPPVFLGPSLARTEISVRAGTLARLTIDRHMLHVPIHLRIPGAYVRIMWMSLSFFPLQLHAVRRMESDGGMGEAGRSSEGRLPGNQTSMSPAAAKGEQTKPADRLEYPSCPSLLWVNTVCTPRSKGDQTSRSERWLAAVFAESDQDARHSAQTNKLRQVLDTWLVDACSDGIG